MAFDRKTRHNKLAAGISVGSEEITAGTLTGKFLDLTDGSIVTVSNRHVYEGTPGETKILQPGKYDGGTKPDDIIGILKRKVEWDKPEKMPWWKRIICMLFGWLLEEWCTPSKKPNHLDAAVASWEPADKLRTLESGVYLDDGSILKVKETCLGDGILGKTVWKCGRTTGITKGRVVDDKAKVKVWYGDAWRIFEDVVLVEGIARGGDSGSPVFLLTGDEPSDKDKLCGILFAGSTRYWVHCKYKYLFSELKVRWQP